MTPPVRRHPMTPVIAVRRLPWRRDDGTEVTIEVRFGQPVPVPGAEVPDADWYCPYQIERFNRPFQIEPFIDVPSEDRELLVEEALYGVDAVQALCHALAMVGTHLQYLGGTPDPSLSDIPNFGFPSLTEMTQAAV